MPILGVVSCLAAFSIGLSAGFLLLRTGGVGACDVGGRCSLRFGLLSSASALARTSGDVRFVS